MYVKRTSSNIFSFVLQGRGGKGNIYVWATGNGGLTDDDCNCDGYTTSIYTISIGAISDHGLSTYYTETCASTLAVTFSGGSHRETVENKVVSCFNRVMLRHPCPVKSRNSLNRIYLFVTDRGFSKVYVRH